MTDDARRRSEDMKVRAAAIKKLRAEGGDTYWSRYDIDSLIAGETDAVAAARREERERVFTAVRLTVGEYALDNVIAALRAGGPTDGTR